MKIAVFADVHSNVEALKAVLDDIEKRSVDRIICAGDLVGYAPFPNEVIDLIGEKEIPTVMGNYDDGVGNQRLVCGCDYKTEEARIMGEQSIRWTKENTAENNKAFLRDLPAEIRFQAGGRDFLVVHGSPRRLNEYLRYDTPDSVLAEILAESECDVLICGHTHVPFYRIIGSGHVINVGSIGKPKHGNPQAVYALIESGMELSVSFVQVDYNYEATAQAIEASELPGEFAELVRKGQG